MKILITTPNLNITGGVSNYYNIIKKYFTLDIEYFNVGSDLKKENIFLLLKNRFSDYIIFNKKLKSGIFNLVVINPSLDIKSIIRDGLFAFISRKRKISFIVFFRGWDLEYEKIMRKTTLKFIRFTFFKARAIIVLAKDFENTFRNWGYKNNIYKETTVVDDEMLININEKTIEKKYNASDDQFVVLFISRIIKEKGIFELAKAFQILYGKSKKIRLIIAGDGKDKKTLDYFIKTNNISNVILVGNLKGSDKEKLFCESKLYVLPSYTEGMPNSLLEALAFGLPAVTTDVGGIKDIFVDKKMGLILKDIKPETIAEKILELADNMGNLKTIAINNYRFAKKNIVASKVTKRLETIYSENII